MLIYKWSRLHLAGINQHSKMKLSYVFPLNYNSFLLYQ